MIKYSNRRDRKYNINIKKTLLLGFILGLVLGSILFLINKNFTISFIAFVLLIVATFFYVYFSASLKISGRIKMAENIFPDFLQLISSNLRAGMTIDRAMLLSSRKEFYPLDEEILRTGKDMATGKNIEAALLDLSKRIGSGKIHKTILLLISGIKAGGNLATLLEETSLSMREQNFIAKKAASNVLMYVIFIFFAVSVGAPILFSLSGILVQVMVNLLSGMPAVETGSINIPFTLSTVNISMDFIKYFSIIFLIVTDVLASLILGLVSKGDEKQGLKYLLPLVIISLTIFFAVKLALAGFIGDLFSLS